MSFERAATKWTDIAIRINELSYRVIDPVAAIMMCAEFVNRVKRSSAIRSRAMMYRIIYGSVLNSFSLLNMRNKAQSGF